MNNTARAGKLWRLFLQRKQESVRILTVNKNAQLFFWAGRLHLVIDIRSGNRYNLIKR